MAYEDYITVSTNIITHRKEELVPYTGILPFQYIRYTVVNTVLDTYMRARAHTRTLTHTHTHTTVASLKATISIQYNYVCVRACVCVCVCVCVYMRVCVHVPVM